MNTNHFFMVLGSLGISSLKICIHKELPHPAPIRLGGVFCPTCSFPDCMDYKPSTYFAKIGFKINAVSSKEGHGHY